MEVPKEMLEYIEKSSNLPVAKNANEFRAARALLANLKATEMAEILADQNPDNPATRIYRRGMLTPVEFWYRLQEGE